MNKSRTLLKGGIQALNVGQAAQIPKHLKFEAPRIEVPQRAVPQMEVPQNERSPLTRFFPLSIDIFSSPEVRSLSGDAFRVFLWMSTYAWQFPTSKGQVQASIGRVSRETGVSEASASRIFAALQAKGLIQQIKSDFKYGNIWQVRDLARAKGRDAQQASQTEGTQNEPPQIQAPRIEAGCPSKRGDVGGSM